MTEQAAGPDDVGAELARAREAAGLAVADVAQQLKFASRQIEALEDDRYGDLPPGMFARGMVRAYARLVKLDPEPLVQRIAARVAVPDNAAAVAAAQRPIPIVDKTRRTDLAYAALSLAILAAIGALALGWQRERARAARLTFVPAAAQAPAQVAVDPPRQTAALAAPNVVTPEVTTLAPPEPPPAREADKAAVETPAASSGRHRIAMRFERESWVEIRGRNGRILTSELNRGGTERTVEGYGPFTLVIGNAQHVRLSYDDRPIDLAPHVKVEVARFTLE